MSDGWNMTLEELELRAARWGAATEEWPDADRSAAEALLARSAEARDLIAALQAMEADLTFAAADGATPSDALTARILADAAEIGVKPATSVTTQARKTGLAALWDRLPPVWRPAVACAASALLGVWLGYVAPQDVAEAATAMAAFEPAEEFAALDMEDGEFDIAFADMGTLG